MGEQLWVEQEQVERLPAQESCCKDLSQRSQLAPRSKSQPEMSAWTKALSARSHEVANEREQIVQEDPSALWWKMVPAQTEKQRKNAYGDKRWKADERALRLEGWKGPDGGDLPQEGTSSVVPESPRKDCFVPRHNSESMVAHAPVKACQIARLHRQALLTTEMVPDTRRHSERSQPSMEWRKLSRAHLLWRWCPSVTQYGAEPSFKCALLNQHRWNECFSRCATVFSRPDKQEAIATWHARLRIYNHTRMSSGAE